MTPSTVSAPSVTNGSRLSIDNNSEEDWFQFSTLGASLLTVTVTPLGVVVASAGAILLLVAVVRRGRI